MTMYDFVTVATVFLIVAAVVAVIVGGAFLFERKACYSKYAAYQPEYVGLTTGCMITVDEQRVPIETLRMTM